MRQFAGLALLVLVCSALNETETSPQQKEGLGEGHYYGHNNHHRHHRKPNALVDDYVCDIDASILIVTQVKKNDYGGENPSYRTKRSNYPQPPPPPPQQYPPHQPPPQYPPPQQGYTPAPAYPPQQPEYQQPQPYYQAPPQPLIEPNADRLRCSGIAYTSLADCQICCKLAARHDQSFSKHDVVGFLIDFNQLDFDGESPFPTLSKPPSAPYHGHHADGRCLCCAPKRKVYYRREHNHHHHNHHGY